MKAASREIHPVVTVNNGKIVTDSLNIAKVFKKRHADVLRDIRSLDIPADFIERNFALNEFTDAIGRKLPMYNLTRDGFTLGSWRLTTWTSRPSIPSAGIA
jgi:Rha family phage regulatory protein